VSQDGRLCVSVEWTSRCLPGQKPKLLQSKPHIPDVDGKNEEMGDDLVVGGSEHV